MKVWRFASPAKGEFAAADRRGSWTVSETPGVCPECSASRQRRSKPLVMAWQPGSDRVGDFVWPGLGGEVVVTDRVLEAIQGISTGSSPGPWR